MFGRASLVAPALLHSSTPKSPQPARETIVGLSPKLGSSQATMIRFVRPSLSVLLRPTVFLLRGHLDESLLGNLFAKEAGHLARV
jgi:hypothetical protein